MRSVLNAGTWLSLCLGLAVSAHGANHAPVISVMPTLSSPSLAADGLTEYTVTLTATDADGYGDLRDMRTLFNHVRAAGDHGQARGYLAWGATDGDITRYGGTWVAADAAGGGRWAWQSGDWGSDTYMMPTGCQASVAGAASGGSGSRTVVWTFKPKPAWAANPVINTADAFIADYAVNVGWREGSPEFDVLAGPCGPRPAAPAAPIISATGESSMSFSVPGNATPTDLFAVRIDPPVAGLRFVQPDGSIGGFPAWQTAAAWAPATATGLGSSTTYSLRARAIAGLDGCPSDWGPAATATTAVLSAIIDVTADGTPIHKGVLGMDSQAKNVAARLDADTLAASWNTSMRFGGDGYNWKTRTAEWNSGTRSTLHTLRVARDQNSHVQMCLNTRGIGTGNGSTWAYTDQTPETLAALAADWVYYCNKIVPYKRQGDPLTAAEQAIIDSISWGADDKLLAPGEPPTPVVEYWEIGNEPEGPFPPPALSPADYAHRYSLIAGAMLAIDPTIKLGPCVMSADNGNAWLDAVFANQANRVDFVAYHPYGPLYWITKSTSGGVLNAEDLAGGLNTLKRQQTERRQKVVDRLVANGRGSGTPLIASEWNPSSWEGTWYYGLHQTVAQGLGVAETIFSFAELGFVAAQYWDFPNYPSTTAVETPGFKVFKAIQARRPAQLIRSAVDGQFRLYATMDAEASELVVWCINMSETLDKPVRLQITGPVRADEITEFVLADSSGATSLVTRNIANTGVERIVWTQADRTGEWQLNDAATTCNHATLKMIVFKLRYLARADFDQDDDVDQEDFGHLQACTTGPATPASIECHISDLDGDGDVDAHDVSRFATCLSGPGVVAAEGCP